MRRIKLTQGYSAIVDDEDYDFLSRWKWHVLVGSKVYAMRNSTPSNGKRHHILMHRFILKAPSGKQIDHINGDSLDNRKKNLRIVTKKQNMWNRNPNTNCTSSFRGVYWHKQHRKWCAAISVNKKRHHIGLFNCEISAAKAYDKRAILEFGKFYRRQINE